MKKSFTIFSLFFFVNLSVFSQQTRGIVKNPSMQILKEDLVIVNHRDSSGARTGIDLYIRKKNNVKSIMLCETVKDKAGKEASYAYRAKEFNEVNGNEIRYLDGKELKSEYSKYSLISSTVKNHPKLGECFHIYIPNELEYGYPWARNGSLTIGKGTFINIRTFEKPYGDYDGTYMDNPFMFNFEEKKKVEPPEKKEVVLTDDYNPEAASKFAELAEEGSGILYYSKKENLTKDMLAAVEEIKGDRVDIVFAIDSTGSMKDDMKVLQKEWTPEFIEQIEKKKDFRIGLLFYRDYNDSYSYKGLPVKYFPFTEKTKQFVKNLNSVYIRGNEGGDIPEAVYEALYAALEYYDWRKDAEKKIILLGDAEPHPDPRGIKKINLEKVTKIAKEKNVKLDCIIVPDEKEMDGMEDVRKIRNLPDKKKADAAIIAMTANAFEENKVEPLP